MTKKQPNAKQRTAAVRNAGEPSADLPNANEANPNEPNVLKGTVESIVFHSDSSDYTVLELVTDDKRLVTAVGILPMTAEGEEIILRGHWANHPEYGKQFAFDSFEKRLPSENDGILRYLSSRVIKGIGPVTAQKIVDRFGTETFDVIENHPEWLADIPGIPMKKASQISQAFREQTGLRGIMMFAGSVLGTNEVVRAYRRFGPGAVGILKENPYLLCQADCGISFDKADSLAEMLGTPPDHFERVVSGLIYILGYNAQTNGHTCLPTEKLIESGAALLHLPPPTVEEIFRKAAETKRLVTFLSDGKEFAMTVEADRAESYIAAKILELDSFTDAFSNRDIVTLIDKAEASAGIRYAELQRQALFEALQGGVMILTGGPGTGKTTVVKAMLSLFKSIGLKTVLAAPTGRAAKRMSEATSFEAKTVHRMLEMERAEGNGSESRFNRNAKNPLEEKVVIVDEASMMDIWLTEALLRALRRGSRLILIGDSHQLPSVGAGNILSDLLATGAVRTVCLHEIFRQAAQSLIVTNAHRINEGAMPVLDRTDGDFFFVRRENEKEIPATVADLLTRRLPNAYGESIRGQIQVITPSRKGSGGVEILNATLQSALNPPDKRKKEVIRHGVTFREGDRVMQNANNYDMEWERGSEVGTGIFNGDIGVIEGISPDSERLRIRFDDRTVDYGFEDLDQLELAYAITVHKSQGSEYPVVILPVYRCAPMLLSRNLLYTALTRAKRMVILVGKGDVIPVMVGNNREILRYTTLSARISEKKSQNS